MTLSQIYNLDSGFDAREKINTSFETIDILWGLTNSSSSIGSTSSVYSVNGMTGSIILTTDEISEGSNLYYEDSKVQTYLNTISLIDGVGTSNYLSKFSDSNTLTSSQIFDDGTNVGIGTITPLTKLQVVGGSGQGVYSTSTNDIAINGVGTGASSYGVKGETNLGTAIFAKITNGSGTTGVAIRSHDANGNSMLTVYGDGTVGIGNGTDSLVGRNKLHIDTTTNLDGIVLSHTSIFATRMQYQSGYGGIIRAFNDVGDNTVQFYGGNFYSFINNGNNFGLGTSTPLRKLHIETLGTELDGLLFTQNTTNFADVAFQSSHGGSLRLYDNIGGTSVQIYGDSYFSFFKSDMRIGSSLTPTAKLHISGVNTLSGNFALKVDNSTPTNLLSIANNGSAYFQSILDGDSSGVDNYSFKSTTGGLRTSYYNEAGFGSKINFITNNILTTQINESAGGIYAISSTSRISLKTLADNKTHLYMGSNGQIGIGDDFFTTDASLHVKGLNSVASSFTAKFVNSSDATILTLENNRAAIFGGNVYIENDASLYAKNSGGTYELAFFGRSVTDNITGINYGTGGFTLRNSASSSTLYINDSKQMGFGDFAFGATMLNRFNFRVADANAEGIRLQNTLATDGVGNFVISAGGSTGYGISGWANSSIIENGNTGSLVLGSYLSDIKFQTGARSNNMVLTSTGILGIGVASPNNSAILDLTSTTKGFLPTRMTGTQAEAISTPAEGLLLYATDGSGVTITSKGWWGYDGATWVKLN